MAKIICDVCGTSYPETSTQCPICGCVSSIDGSVSIENPVVTDEPRDSEYTYVKGGRFSKSNVKKKNRTEQTAHSTGASAETEGESVFSGNRKVFLYAAIVAIVVVIAVVIFLTVRFFTPGASGKDSVPGTTDASTAATTQTTSPTETTEATQAATEETVPPVSCTDVIISKTSVTLSNVGESVLLNVTVTPADTTDELVFTSDNENVATVSQTGKVTAVAGGEAIITATCGQISATCKITCTMEPAQIDSTEPTQEATTSTETSDFALTDARGNVYSDITLSYKGENYLLYSGDVALDQITWWSDNQKVATFEAGVVKAVGKGVTTIYAEYNGAKVSCIVRCKDTVGSADTGISGSGNVSEGGGETSDDPVQAGTCVISADDVTIAVGETFTLTLTKENGDPVFATWSVGNSGVCSVNNNLITGVASGMTTVSYTYEGTTYSCIVRVK